jgi:ribosomal protein S18 acetylase RimI-like enzyme
MKIRPLGIKDYEAMMDLWKRAGFSTLRPFGRDSREAFARQSESSATAQAEHGQQTVLGLLTDGQLVGVVVATHDGRKGWINRLAIDPRHRRRGHAKQLIEAAEQLLRAQGIHVIAALIKHENAASLALFQHAGYHLHDDINYLSKRDSNEA